MSARKWSQEEIAAKLGYLRNTLRIGDTIYGVKRPGGVSLYQMYPANGTIRSNWITPKVAAVIGCRYNDTKEVLVTRSTEELAYNLARALWGDREAVKQGTALRVEWL